MWKNAEIRLSLWNMKIQVCRYISKFSNHIFQKYNIFALFTLHTLNVLFKKNNLLIWCLIKVININKKCISLQTKTCFPTCWFMKFLVIKTVLGSFIISHLIIISHLKTAHIKWTWIPYIIYINVNIDLNVKRAS